MARASSYGHFQFSILGEGRQSPQICRTCRFSHYQILLSGILFYQNHLRVNNKTTDFLYSTCRLFSISLLPPLIFPSSSLKSLSKLLDYTFDLSPIPAVPPLGYSIFFLVHSEFTLLNLCTILNKHNNRIHVVSMYLVFITSI